MFSNKKKRDGISLRTLYIIMLIGGVIISAAMLYTTHKLFNSFQNLTEASKQRIELRQAVRQLTDASDYLTEQVQRATAVDMFPRTSHVETVVRLSRRDRNS